MQLNISNCTLPLQIPQTQHFLQHREVERGERGSQQPHHSRTAQQILEWAWKRKSTEDSERRERPWKARREGLQRKGDKRPILNFGTLKKTQNFYSNLCVCEGEATHNLEP